MIFGVVMFTVLHVAVSLVGIVAGLVVAGGLAAGRHLDRWALVFLVTTVLANATGFGFPFVILMPSHIIGAVSLVVLPVAAFAYYVKHFAGAWRRIYVVSVVLATWFNVFVLVAQLFKRIPALMFAAPTQSEPPFAITQGVVLLLFVWLGVMANRGFRAA